MTWPLRCPHDGNKLRQVPPPGAWPGHYHCGNGHHFNTPFTLTLDPVTPNPTPRDRPVRPLRGKVPWWAK